MFLNLIPDPKYSPKVQKLAPQAQTFEIFHASYSFFQIDRLVSINLASFLNIRVQVLLDIIINVDLEIVIVLSPVQRLHNRHQIGFILLGKFLLALSLIRVEKHSHNIFGFAFFEVERLVE